MDDTEASDRVQLNVNLVNMLTYSFHPGDRHDLSLPDFGRMYYPNGSLCR